MKIKLWDTLLIAVAAVLIAFLEWQLTSSLDSVWRIVLSIFTGVALAAVLILIDLKTRR